jgi:hypothetical protein
MSDKGSAEDAIDALVGPVIGAKGGGVGHSRPRSMTSGSLKGSSWSAV